jgi:DNA-binding FadR family transcriptional regulator
LKPKQPEGARQSSGRIFRQPGRNLTEQVIESLRRRVTDGTLKPGDKLPTEKLLIEEFGVSRTVVREAISGLRADGLVEPRQGIGVFVREPEERHPEMAFLSVSPDKISAIIEMLELRAAVEIEAAGLAAIRCSPAQEISIREAFSDMEQHIAKGESAGEADREFHLAIADATNNRSFRDFFTFLGSRTIPRAQLDDSEDRTRLPTYVRQVQDEHRAIMEAICDRDSDAARDAMRVHLKGSQDRYKRLIRS